jgi:hypothetical protein
MKNRVEDKKYLHVYATAPGHKYILVMLRSKTSIAFFDVLWQYSEYISLGLSAIDAEGRIKQRPLLANVEEICTHESLMAGATLLSSSDWAFATMRFNLLGLPGGLLARGDGRWDPAGLCMPVLAALIMAAW